MDFFFDGSCGRLIRYAGRFHRICIKPICGRRCHFKKKEGDTGKWKIGQNGELEIYVDGKFAGVLLADDKIYIPNSLMGDLNKGGYHKPYQEPKNYDDEEFDFDDDME